MPKQIQKEKPAPVKQPEPADAPTTNTDIAKKWF